MKILIKIVYVFIMTALSISCSKNGGESKDVSLVKMKQAHEFEKTKPVLDWISKMEYISDGVKTNVSVKEIVDKEKTENLLLSLGDGIHNVKFSKSKNLQSLNVISHSCNLEFSILKAFGNLSFWVSSQVESISGKENTTESSSIKVGEYLISNTTSSSEETVGKDLSSNVNSNIKVTNLKNDFLQFHEKTETTLNLDSDQVKKLEYNLARTGDLDFKTFIKNTLSHTEESSQKYDIQIYFDKNETKYWTILNVRFPNKP